VKKRKKEKRKRTKERNKERKKELWERQIYFQYDGKKNDLNIDTTAALLEYRKEEGKYEKDR
jgi:hypothetical protein